MTNSEQRTHAIAYDDERISARAVYAESRTRRRPLSDDVAAYMARGSVP